MHQPPEPGNGMTRLIGALPAWVLYLCPLIAGGFAVVVGTRAMNAGHMGGGLLCTFGGSLSTAVGLWAAHNIVTSRKKP